MVIAIGFSQSTCTPASRQATVIAQCAAGGVQITAASGWPGPSSASREGRTAGSSCARQGASEEVVAGSNAVASIAGDDSQRTTVRSPRSSRQVACRRPIEPTPTTATVSPMAAPAVLPEPSRRREGRTQQARH